ncbi:hypothetical protein Rhe02_44780 [Rhizocola hellebori]|uniref:Uncharacterized protein n=1 Tax=Rhizocola hellebori TaxID=1392758 RepID=A0A8J3QBA6_9ACTN|nr:hypothetical protein [Rhizocola hellebori]GIH06411.1 hypothetical protein Rhe02_44780 [Rhizocola hellebori]
MWRDPVSAAALPKKVVTNTFGFGDNCYYVTIAKLLNTTVSKLVDKTGEMQLDGGAQDSEIKALLDATGEPYQVATVTSLAQAEEIALQNNLGFSKKFAIRFTRPDSTRHMIVLKWDSMQQVCEYRDYQRNNDGADGREDISRGQVDLVVWFPNVN